MIIGFTNRKISGGGPGTFQKRFIAYAQARGWRVVYPSNKVIPDVVIVNIGTTKKLWWVIYCKLRGSEIVLRTANISWSHKVKNVSLKVYFMYSWNNFMTNFIRNRMADRVIYQSKFAVKMFEKWHGKNIDKSISKIIYNGTDIQLFRPRKLTRKDENIIKIICVEGNIDNENYISSLLNVMSKYKYGNKEIRVKIYGNVDKSLENMFEQNTKISFEGYISREKIPMELSDSDIFLSLEINASCPNAIIEALATGLPVIGFSTGATPELVNDSCGYLIPYGSDVWKLERPIIDCDKLYTSLNRIIEEYVTFSENARERAIRQYDFTSVFKNYLNQK